MARKETEAEAAPYGVAAEAAAAGRPSHIVVFRESAEKIAGVMQKAVRRTGTKSFTVAENVVGMGEKGEGGRAEHTVFERLKVATANLTDEEHRKLLASEEVEAIVPNRRRYIQMMPQRTGGGGSLGGSPSVRAQGGVVRSSLPFGAARPAPPAGGNLPFAGDPRLLAYLAGQRDMLDSLLARLGGGEGGGAEALRRRRRRHRPGESTAALTWGLAAIGVTGADDQLTGKGVRVADLDTGLDLTHPDWSDNPVATDPERTRNFVPPNVPGGASVMDVVGHGTHTAGTIAGPLRSVGGTRYGVAPNCDLFVGKVLDDTGSGFDSDIIEGIQWALTNKCRLINMSLGAARDRNDPFSIAYERLTQRVLDMEDGALIVAAAGNESQRDSGEIAPVGNPAACPSILAVAAVDSDMQVAYFSCGQVDEIGIVDLAGPGVDVYSSVPVAMGRFDGTFDGTSMATPHVTGVAACILQASPNLTPRQLWDRLRASARPLSAPATDVGRGLVQMP